MEKAAFGSLLLPPTCHIYLLSTFPNGGWSLLGHSASFLISRDHTQTSFPAIDQKLCALLQLEGMCPSVRPIPPLIRKKDNG